jgi:hypothetical protein
MRPWVAGVVIAFMAIVATACCPVAALKPVVEPPRLGELPTVSAQDLQCLSAETYERLVVRELILRAAFADCMAIVEEVSDGP